MTKAALHSHNTSGTLPQEEWPVYQPTPPEPRPGILSIGRKVLTYSIEWLSVLHFLVVGTVLSQDIDVLYSRVRRGAAPEHPCIRVFAMLTLCVLAPGAANLIRYRRFPVPRKCVEHGEREGAAVLK